MDTSSFKINNVWLRGIIWAVLVFLITEILVPLIEGGAFEMHRWPIRGAIWLLLGIAMAHATEFFEKRKKRG